MGDTPARGGTPFSGALAAVPAPADPAPATTLSPANPAVQPAGSNGASIAAEALIQPAAAASAAAAPAAVPYWKAHAPEERPCAEPDTVAESLPPPAPPSPRPLPPPSPPPSPPPPPSPQEQHEQRQRTDACGTTPEAASREPDMAVGHTEGLAAALHEHDAAASLPSSPAPVPEAEEEQLDPARSSRRHTRRSSRRRRKGAASSKVARAPSPEHAMITAMAVGKQQSTVRKRRWDQREGAVEQSDAIGDKAAAAQLLAPAALRANAAVDSKQQPSSRRRR